MSPRFKLLSLCLSAILDSVTAQTVNNALPPSPNGSILFSGREGIVVVNDGSRLEKYSDVFQFKEFVSFGQTFRITRFNGSESIHFTGHIRALVHYELSDADKTETKLRQVGESYLNAKGIVSAVIPELRRQRSMQEKLIESNAAQVKATTMPKLTIHDIEYVNLRPIKLQNGVMSFIHDSGAVRISASLMSYAMILKFSEMNPELLNDLEFSLLIRGFVPSLSLPNKRLTGVRLMEKTASTVKVLADSGIVLEPLENFTADQMAALDEAKISEDKYWQNAMEGLARIEESKRRAIARKEELLRHEEETKREQAKLKINTMNFMLGMLAKGLAGSFSGQSDGSSQSHSDDIRRYRNEYEVRQNEMAKSDGRDPPHIRLLILVSTNSGLGSALI